MKKGLVLLFLVVFCGGIILFSVGCGGSSGGGIIAALTGVIAVAAIFSAGSAGSTAAFAANLHAATTTNKYKAKIVVTRPVSYATETTNLELYNNNKEIRVNFNLNLQRSDKIEYKVCLYPANDENSDPLMVAYKITSLDSDNKQENITVNASTTAKALAYETWSKNKQNVYFDQFYPDPTTINEISQKIQTVYNNSLNSNLQNFSWQSADNNIIQKINEIASDTPQSLNANLITGVVKLYLDDEMIINPNENNNPEVVVRKVSSEQLPSVVGISYFHTHQPSIVLTLGNFYYVSDISGAPDTKLIRYMPGVSSLNDITVATDTYNHHAFGGDMANVINELQKNQVYCFVIDGYYGALKILEVYTLQDYNSNPNIRPYVKFEYRFNKNKGNKNLANSTTFAASFR